jgi:glycosyltransferase involved in cell wall biosynthesis
VQRVHAVAYVEARYGIAEPFVLTVGDLQPRKNQAGLVRAFAALVRNFPQLPHRLVIAGKDKWQGSQVMKAIRAAGIQDRVHLPGFVSDEDLLYLYNACDLFVFPSFYEGFGLPVLEAMACNRAVACSNASALPEVADGAAIFFDPHRPDEITRALRDLLLDSELRARMERLGSQRAAHFSWEKTARRTLEVYNEVGRVSRESNLQSRATSMSHS